MKPVKNTVPNERPFSFKLGGYAYRGDNLDLTASTNERPFLVIRQNGNWGFEHGRIRSTSSDENSTAVLRSIRRRESGI